MKNHLHPPPKANGRALRILIAAGAALSFALLWYLFGTGLPAGEPNGRASDPLADSETGPRILAEASQSAAPSGDLKTAKAEKRIAELMPQYEAALMASLEKKREIDERSADLNRAMDIAHRRAFLSDRRWDELIDEFQPKLNHEDFSRLFEFSREFGHSSGLLRGLSLDDKVNGTTLGKFLQRSLDDAEFVEILSKWIARTERNHFGTEEGFDPFAGTSDPNDIRARLEHFSERHTARLRQEVNRVIPAHLNALRDAYIEREGAQKLEHLLSVLHDRRYAEVETLRKPIGRLGSEIYALAEQFPPTSEERAQVGNLLKAIHDKARAYEEPAKMQPQ